MEMKVWDSQESWRYEEILLHHQHVAKHLALSILSGIFLESKKPTKLLHISSLSPPPSLPKQFLWAANKHEDLGNVSSGNRFKPLVDKIEPELSAP